MASANKLLYDELFSSYRKAYPSKTHTSCDKDVSQLWKSFKQGEKGNFEEDVRKEISNLKLRAKTTKHRLDGFWLSIPAKKAKESEDIEIISPPAEVPPPPSDVGSNINPTDVPEKSTGKTPAQDLLRQKLLSVNQDLIHLSQKKEKGLATDEDEKQLKLLKLSLNEAQKKLTALESGQARKQKQREKDRKLLNELSEEHPEVAEKLKRRTVIGRPRLEETQPGLLDAIIKIAIHGSGADERRRSEKLRSVKTLDDLTEELRNLNYNLSRSSVYLRLLPSNRRSIEGKNHVQTVPVKLVRSQNNLHKNHPDTNFCKIGIKYLEELASVLGPDQVIFISQDDKARVPLGITAANKQAPILMHMDYSIKLPDHDWVVAERHKLIPSVYAMMTIQPNQIGNPKAVSYSGPTYVAIRSGKHSSSTAATHGQDLNYLLNLENFSALCKDQNGDVKPVIIIIVDGGPDENPRYFKVMETAISHFKSYNLDAIFIATNAPGRSAYNRVERRMAPLSRELAGLILPHDHFGSHLDERGKTVDTELELANFEHAGQVLAEIWNMMVFDGYETVCRYVQPGESTTPKPMSATWKSKHVREGHYFFQVSKCSDRRCCREPRSDLNKIIPQFIPAPLWVTQENGLRMTSNSDPKSDFSSLFIRLMMNDNEFRGANGEVPFDICCPSLQDAISNRLCKFCGLYHSSLRSLKDHLRVCKQTSTKTQPTSTVSLQEFLRPIPSSRPIRMAARRQHERMIIWSSRLNGEHVDWVDEEDIGAESIDEAPSHDSSTDSNIMPIINYNNYCSSPWTSNIS